MKDLAPFYANVQSHYDLSDEFFALFLDPTRTYSCAYWDKPGYTLEQAQLAKIDLALGKCDLRPGMTLLDIGCGWGSTMLRAMDRYGVDVIGLTLSRNQFDYVSAQLDQRRGGPRGEVRLQGWEEFDQKVDRIVTVGAFEHFRAERYPDFFDFAYRTLPDDGTMLLHTIVVYGPDHLRANGLRWTRSDLAFMRFIRDAIFPGGQLPLPTGTALRGVREYAQEAGFTVSRIQALQAHYAKTLDHWAGALKRERDRAIALSDEQTYLTYITYLAGCADQFRAGRLDVMQFTCTKNASMPV
ncbi:cyclopropane mycolic acid synthase family methyltransferase [Nocardia sp. NPDC051570]|uniref:cyclopropane mycolic acid synthase family methyltransferase n=1 Tax=Nocardia sp. NPDC051570 TaxID=3364324 RepID=UPI0037B2E33B